MIGRKKHVHVLGSFRKKCWIQDGTGENVLFGLTCKAVSSRLRTFALGLNLKIYGLLKYLR